MLEAICMKYKLSMNVEWMLQPQPNMEIMEPLQPKSASSSLFPCPLPHRAAGSAPSPTF
jgi:hypothetical protein